MRFTLYLESGNDAFAGDPAPEIARLTHIVAERVAGGEGEGYLYDVNGNDVGYFRLEED
jgi:hypothetical protein